MTTLERFANFATTALNGAINNSVTSITISSASTFPSVANYRIVIENEIMLVTAGAGTTTWTVTRGYESTTAASHADTTAVSLLLTRGNLSQLTQDRVLCPVVPLVQNTPDVSAFSWIHQTIGATFDQTNGFLCLQSPTNSTQSTTAKAIPTAPYTITMQLALSIAPANTATVGVVLLDNSSNGILAYWENTNETVTFPIQYFTGFNGTLAGTTTLFSSFGLNAGTGTFHTASTNLFSLQIVDDNSGSSTARSFNMSFDGFHWETLYSSSRTSNLTATKIGLYAQSSNSWPARISALSWIETSP